MTVRTLITTTAMVLLALSGCAPHQSRLRELRPMPAATLTDRGAMIVDVRGVHAGRRKHVHVSVYLDAPDAPRKVYDPAQPIDPLMPGWYRVAVRLMGYQAAKMRVEVRAGMTTRLRADMEEVRIALKELTNGDPSPRQPDPHE